EASGMSRSGFADAVREGRWCPAADFEQHGSHPSSNAVDVRGARGDELLACGDHRASFSREVAWHMNRRQIDPGGDITENPGVTDIGLDAAGSDSEGSDEGSGYDADLV